MNTAQPPRPGATEQTQQERLGLIVARVPRRDDVGAELGRDPFEELVARPPAGILERRAEPGGQRPHVNQIRAKRYRPLGRHRAAELFVLARCLAQAVIEVRDAGNRQLPRALELAEQPRQRDRIGASRERDEHTIAPAHERKTTNRVEDALGKCHRVRQTNEPWTRKEAPCSSKGKNGAGAGT